MFVYYNNENKKKNKKILPCIFPYNYKGKEYNTCYPGKKKTWCPIKINSKKEILKYRKCTKKDLVINKPSNKPSNNPSNMNATNIYKFKGKNIKKGKCIFPFVYKSKKYFECFKGKKGDWCATKVNPKTLEVTKYGYCKYTKTNNNNSNNNNSNNNNSNNSNSNNNNSNNSNSNNSNSNNSNSNNNNSNNNNSENWINVFLNDTKYRIIETSTNGDCFFDTVRKSLLSVDKKYTIRQLRNLLVKNFTEDTYNLFNELFMNASIARDLETIIEYKFMRKIKNSGMLRKFLLSNNFWANSWAINIIENELNIKVLILSHREFMEEQIDSVPVCGDMIGSNEPVCEICGLKKSIFDLKPNLDKYKKIHREKGIEDHKWVDKEEEIIFNPDGYLIANYSGLHYELVSYNNKKFFKTLDELPRNILEKFFTKCILEQKGKGKFGAIKAFRELVF